MMLRMCTNQLQILNVKEYTSKWKSSSRVITHSKSTKLPKESTLKMFKKCSDTQKPISSWVALKEEAVSVSEDSNPDEELCSSKLIFKQAHTLLGFELAMILTSRKISMLIWLSMLTLHVLSSLLLSNRQVFLKGNKLTGNPHQNKAINHGIIRVTMDGIMMDGE